MMIDKIIYHKSSIMYKANPLKYSCSVAVSYIKNIYLIFSHQKGLSGIMKQPGRNKVEGAMLKGVLEEIIVNQRTNHSLQSKVHYERADEVPPSSP